MSNDAKRHASWLRMLPACTAEEKMRNLEAADLMEQLEAENAKLLEKVKQLETQIPKWINAKEGLPKELEDVLVYREECYAIARIITGDDWTYCGIGGDPTHWMPLPEPPEKEEPTNQ